MNYFKPIKLDSFKFSTNSVFEMCNKAIKSTQTCKKQNTKLGFLFDPVRIILTGDLGQLDGTFQSILTYKIKIIKPSLQDCSVHERRSYMKLHQI